MHKFKYFASVYMFSNSVTHGGYKMLRKAIKLNNFGTVGVSIPAEYARYIDLTTDSYVNGEKVGNCIHITKVKIE